MPETTISWASHTWNPYTWNCTKVSSGCKHCYAQALAERQGQNFSLPPRWRGKNAMRELRTMPAGSVAFVNSMSDTYHESVPVAWIHSIHNAAMLRPDVTFLLLTKRPERAYGLSRYLGYPPNLWVGTSVEHPDYLWRLEYLLQIPAAGHFVSAEPLLWSLSSIEPYLVATERRAALGWVIVGAESGGQRRSFDLTWARELRDLCQTHDVPFMYKQGSAYKSGQNRILDGRTWDETPFTPRPLPAFSILSLPVETFHNRPLTQKEMF